MLEAGPSTTPIRPVKMVYCDICSYPPEYCSYGSRISKCKKWLLSAHPDLYNKYYGNETPANDTVAEADEDPAVTATSKQLDGMTVDEQKEAAKKEAKAERKAAKEEERRLGSKVIIRRVERTKRKMTTSIQGLEAFNIDLKKSSKLFANKFATGASVSKNAAGEDEIVIQGDVAYEVEEMLLKTTGKEGDLFGGKIPGDNIDVLDVKRKKGAEDS